MKRARPLFIPREHPENGGGCGHVTGGWCLPCQEVRRLQAENEALRTRLERLEGERPLFGEGKE